jgi:hypothetical protein
VNYYGFIYLGINYFKFPLAARTARLSVTFEPALRGATMHQSAVTMSQQTDQQCVRNMSWMAGSFAALTVALIALADIVA